MTESEKQEEAKRLMLLFFQGASAVEKKQAELYAGAIDALIKGYPRVTSALQSCRNELDLIFEFPESKTINSILDAMPFFTRAMMCVLDELDEEDKRYSDLFGAFEIANSFTLSYFKTPKKMRDVLFQIFCADNPVMAESMSVSFVTEIKLSSGGHMHNPLADLLGREL